MCLGTIGDSAAASALIRNGAGLLILTIAVSGSGVSTVSTLAKVLRPRGWTFFSMSIEYATSAEVKGLPSWNFTLGRSLKV